MAEMTLIPYTITWDAPANDGGSKIKKYQFRLTIQDGGTSDWIDLDSADTRLVALLPNDVKIEIEIRAMNDMGASDGVVVEVKPVRTPNPNDRKKMGDKFVNIPLSNALKEQEK